MKKASFILVLFLFSQNLHSGIMSKLSLMGVVFVSYINGIASKKVNVEEQVYSLEKVKPTLMPYRHYFEDSGTCSCKCSGRKKDSTKLQSVVKGKL